MLTLASRTFNKAALRCVWEGWSWGGPMLGIKSCASTSLVPQTATQTEQCGCERQRQTEESEGMLFVEDG